MTMFYQHYDEEIQPPTPREDTVIIDDYYTDDMIILLLHGEERSIVAGSENGAVKPWNIHLFCTTHITHR